MKNRQLYLVVIGVLLLSGAAWADDDDNGDGRGRGSGTSEADSRTLDFRLVQVGAFNPGVSQASGDQLTAGANNHLTVKRDRTVQVEFHPVPVPSVTNPVYRVWLCRYAGLPLPINSGNGCVAMLDPQASPAANAAFKPDTSGFVRGTAVFPPMPDKAPLNADVWVGSFVVTRDGVEAPQFVSAIDFQTAPSGAPIGIVTGPEMELTSEIVSLEKQWIGLAGVPFLVQVDASTRFDGKPNSMDDLKVGMTVNVRGVMQTDTASKTSFLLAERVRAEHDK